MPTLRDVHLSVVNNKIYVNPDSLKAQDGDVIRFVVDTPNTTFEIAIHNFDGYLTIGQTIIVTSVSSTSPVTYTIDTSPNLVKYYSVCVLGVTPAPIQPDAPPRIIRTVVAA